MAKPVFLRYLPARLKPLGKPAVWAPLTVVALLGTLLWEYHKNPDWFNREPITTLNPESSLTPEEQARLSEIDTLDLLLNSSRVSEDTKAVTSQINPDAPVEASESAADSAVATPSSLERYPVPGSTTPTTTLTPTQPSTSLSGVSGASTGSSSTNGSTFNFSSSLVNPSAPSTNSALSEALNRREAARAAAEQEGAAATDELDNGQPSSTFGGTGADNARQVAPTAQPVPGSFIRTTPEMSPPVGTTGYRPPATSTLPAFNLAPTQPTRSLLNSPAGQLAPSVSGGPAVPAPANVAAPAIGAPGAAGGSLYTAPTSVQPDQGRPINPRR